MIRVLIVTPIFPPEIGGPATYSLELLKRLPLEIEVKVTGFGKKLVPVGGGMVVRQLKLFLACLVKGWDSDIFYLLEPAVVGLVGLAAARILGKKVMIKYVGDPEWEENARGGRPHGWLARVTELVLNSSDRVIVPANHLTVWLAKKYHVMQKNIVVIANSVDPVKGEKKVSGRIVYVGRLAPWKNVDLIREATGILKKRRVKLSLEIVSGVSREKAREEIAKSEILVLFSDYEGLSHVALEAMAVGTVVVASDIPGNRELVTDGVTGLLVEPKNTRKLSEALEKLLKDGELRKKLAERSFELVNKDYSWDNNLTKLKNVFNKMASSGGSS